MTPFEETEFLREYGITFNRRVPRKQWPQQYARIFANVLEVEAFIFDTYVSPTKGNVGGDDQELPHRLRMKTRARSPICHEKRWKSEIQAMPDDPEAASRLRRKRIKRSLCYCEPTADDEAMQEDFDRFIFDDQGSEGVFYDKEDSADRRLPNREPDRVFGLQRSKVFNRLLGKWQNKITCSPFREQTPIFPFLIVEAKSEKGSPGWESIERQTAFPIRTMLKIQMALVSDFAEDGSLRPLVWFFAYEGSEWRLYACVVDERKFQIFDLWHAYIVDMDDALRLLHVVDFIYDWGRDIYRSNVLRCLENPRWGLRGVTPSDSRIDSLADSAEVSLVPTVHTNRVEGGFIMSYPKRLLVHLIRGKKDPVKESKTKLDIYFTPDVDCATLEGIQKVPAIIWRWQIDALPYPSAARILTLKPHIQYYFTNLHITDERIESLLDDLYPPSDRTNGARTLLQLFNEKTCIADWDIICRLENCWTGEPHSHCSDIHLLPSKEKLFSRIFFKTFFYTESWTIVKQLNCLTASASALEKMRSISDSITPAAVKEEDIWRVPHQDLEHTLAKFRTWNFWSVTAAMLQLHWELDGPKSLYPDEEGYLPASWDGSIESESNSGDGCHELKLWIKDTYEETWRPADFFASAGLKIPDPDTDSKIFRTSTLSVAAPSSLKIPRPCSNSLSLWSRFLRMGTFCCETSRSRARPSGDTVCC